MRKVAAVSALIGVVSIAILLEGCTRKEPGPEAKTSAPVKVPVAEVGDLTILQSDVDAANDIRKLLENLPQSDAGLGELIRTYTLAQILKNHGRTFDRDALEKETARIESQPANKNIYNDVKALFAEKGKYDRETYLRVFALPALAERTIYHDFFLNDAEAQREALAKAQEFFETVKAKPETFEAVAEEKKLKVMTLKITANSVADEYADRSAAPPSPTAPSSTPDGMASYFAVATVSPPDSQPAAWLELGKDLVPPQVFPKVLDQHDRWLVMRILSRSLRPMPSIRAQAVAFPKADYAAWLEAEKAKVKVTRSTK